MSKFVKKEDKDCKEKKGNFNERGSRSGRRRGSKKVAEKSKDETFDVKGRDNDPSWYFKSKELAEQVCHLSFNSFIGEGNLYGSRYALPSVIRVPVNPSPFNSYDIEAAGNYSYIRRSGLNLAITQLYTLLASYSGRAASYAPQDVGTVILAMGEIVSMVEDMRRCVGVTYTFSERNRALPKLLTHALGYDYDDFIRNRAIYLDRLNAIITRFNSLPILGNVSYILKCRDMYQKVYVDSPSPEATVIVMVPDTTWELDETSYSGGTILKTTAWTPVGAYNTFKDHLDTLETMVDALFGSSTLNIIYADLLNLASKVKVDMFKLDYVTEDYIVIPEYNSNFLMQLHNADIIGTPSGTSFTALYSSMMMTPSNDVYPDAANNGLLYNPVWNYAYNQTPSQTSHYISYIDLPEPDTSVENIIESTRFKAMVTATYADPSNPSMIWTPFAVLPDHYVTGWYTWTSNNGILGGASPSDFWRNPSNTVPIELIATHSQVDWAPLMYYQDPAVNNQVAEIIGDLNFYTNIPPVTLQAMNRIIAQDLFKFDIG